MKSLASSQAARRRAAAAIASVGAGILGTQSAEAGIVTIDLASFGMTGVNAGLTYGTFRNVYNFPISSSGSLQLTNLSYAKGIDFGTGSKLAVNSGLTAPRNFAAGAEIGPTSYFTRYAKYQRFKYLSSQSAVFGANSYLGFQTSQGNYGWLRATWDGTNFQLYSGAYESVAGTPINAGATGTAVPEIDPTGLASAMSLVMGSAAMLEQRRRKRAAVVAESATVTA
jgi:hypothetical protein